MIIEMDWERRERHRADALARRWFQVVGYVEEGAESFRGKRKEAFLQVLAFIQKLERENPLEPNEQTSQR